MIARIFTDGSFDAPTKTCGWAYQIHLNDKYFEHDSGTDVPKGAEDLWNIAGECMAVIKALSWADCCAKGLDVSDVVINHDYEGVGKWFSGQWKAKKPFTQWYQQQARELAASSGVRIHFEWVKGHDGNPGNEAVDGMAKAAMQAKRAEKKATSSIENRLCVTGHRQLQKSYFITNWEYQTMLSLTRKAMDNGIRFFVSGGALRVDQSFAEIVLKLRDEGLPVKLVMAIPCCSQDKNWYYKNRDKYREILKRADAICLIPLVSENHNGFISYETLELLEAEGRYGYTDNCMIERDHWMVDNVGTVMAVMAYGKSGTAKTVEYAKEKGRKILHLHPIEKTITWMK